MGGVNLGRCNLYLLLKQLRPVEQGLAVVNICFTKGCAR